MFSQPDEDVASFEARHLREVKASAQQGYAPAAYQLGCHYRFGDFVETDLGKAAGLFAFAAESGFPAAMYEYGLALLHGDGVSKDPIAALSWIRQAASRGDGYAIEFLGAWVA